MTVEYIPITKEYEFTGLGEYPFSFYLTNEDYVKVTYEDTFGNITILDKEINYSVVINELPTIGGSIDIIFLEESGGKIKIERDVPIVQRRAWSVEGHLNLPKLELSLDEIVMMVQQTDSFISTEFFSAFRFRGDWASDTIYETLNIVEHEGAYYLAISDFTSGSTFDSDNWSEILNVQSVLTAAEEAQAAQAAAEEAESNAANSQTAASVSETNAANSETNAANSEANSLISENMAANCAAKALEEADRATAATDTKIDKTSDNGQAVIPVGTTAQRDTPSVGHLRFNTDEESFEGYNGVEWGEIGGGGLNWESAIQTTDFIAVPGYGYFVDTSAGAVTITLPAGEAGARVAVRDYNGTFLDYPCILTTTDKMEGTDDDLLLDRVNSYVEVTYTDATQGWKLTASSPLSTEELEDTPPVYTRKNRIINGNFKVKQRAGTSFTNEYCLDRWNVTFVEEGVAHRAFTGLIGLVYPTYMKGSYGYFACNLNADRFTIYQRIESNDVQDLNGEEVTLSFDLNLSGLTNTCELSVSINSADGVNNYTTKTLVHTTVLESATGDRSMTPYSTTFTMTEEAATNGIEVRLNLTSNTGYLSSGAAAVRIGNVQLEKGEEVTDFEYRSQSLEELLCQRFYWSSQIVVSTTDDGRLGNNIIFPVKMIQAPSLTVSNITSGSGAAFTNLDTNTGCYQSQVNTSGARCLLEADAEL